MFSHQQSAFHWFPVQCFTSIQNAVLDKSEIKWEIPDKTGLDDGVVTGALFKRKGVPIIINI
jgi:hypothetical protein